MDLERIIRPRANLNFWCEVLMGPINLPPAALPAELLGGTHATGAFENFQSQVESVRELKCQGLSLKP